MSSQEIPDIEVFKKFGAPYDRAWTAWMFSNKTGMTSGKISHRLNKDWIPNGYVIRVGRKPARQLNTTRITNFYKFSSAVIAELEQRETAKFLADYY